MCNKMNKSGGKSTQSGSGKRPGKKFIHFEAQTLEELLKTDNSCVESQHLTKHLSLHPYHLNNIDDSLKEIISRKVGRFDKKLDGILMGFKNAKIEGSAPMYDENCFIHVNIDADFFLFKPNIGCNLDGVVIKKTADHIGALVHNAFNVSIPKTTSTNTNQNKKWLGDNVKIGQQIRMKIIHTNFEGRFPFIKAELTSVLSEAPPININNDNNASKNKIITFDETEMEELDYVNEDNIDYSVHVESPKKKKNSKNSKKLIEEGDETPKSSKGESNKAKRKRTISESFNSTLNESNDTDFTLQTPAKKVKYEVEKEEENKDSTKKSRKRKKSESFAADGENNEEEPTPKTKKTKRESMGENDTSIDELTTKLLLSKANDVLNETKSEKKAKKKSKHENEEANEENNNEKKKKKSKSKSKSEKSSSELEDLTKLLLSKTTDLVLNKSLEKKNKKRKSKASESENDTKLDNDLEDLQKILVAKISKEIETNKSKKSKPKKSLDSEETKEEKRKARAKKKQQQQEQEQKCSLELNDLNLDNLFNEESNLNMNFNKSSLEMADAVDKGFKIKTHDNTSSQGTQELIEWDGINLPSDSDLDGIISTQAIQNKIKKKQF